MPKSSPSPGRGTWKGLWTRVARVQSPGKVGTNLAAGVGTVLGPLRCFFFFFFGLMGTPVTFLYRGPQSFWPLSLFLWALSKSPTQSLTYLAFLCFQLQLHASPSWFTTQYHLVPPHPHPGLSHFPAPHPFSCPPPSPARPLRVPLLYPHLCPEPSPSQLLPLPSLGPAGRGCRLVPVT